jgi:phosphoribosyl 1,2-cyclic phosphate phosphodiesterase
MAKKIQKATFTLLGTGSSMGIPVIGCNCVTCLSKNEKNKRLRTAALIQTKGKNILIDIGPDFRAQALKSKIEHIDGLILTHLHYDHIAGIDEIRIYNLKQKKQIPCLISQGNLIELNLRYKYIFSTIKEGSSLSVKFDYYILDHKSGMMNFLGLKVIYFTYFQGDTKVNGYRFGNLAYVTDIKNFDDSIYDFLSGVDILILSALRYDASPIHFNVDDAIAFSQKINPKQTFLTHIAHDLEDSALKKYLPNNIALGYDTQKIDFEVEIYG